MITTSFKLTGSKPNIGRGIAFSAFQMQRLADVGLRSVKARAKAGIGSDDTAMPPLTRGYAAVKSRKGGAPLRDLHLTGAMLDNLTVRAVNEENVRIAFTESLARTKALANEQRYPWLGWAPSDVRVILAEAQKMLKDSVSATTGGYKSFRRAA
jgi:hypothetical protein